MSKQEIAAVFRFYDETYRRTVKLWALLAREWAADEKFRKALEDVAIKGKMSAEELAEELAEKRREMP